VQTVVEKKLDTFNAAGKAEPRQVA
jgi:hypothetical protein